MEKVCVIGIGNVGKALVRALRESGIDVTALIDKDIVTAQRFGMCLGAKVASNLFSSIPIQTTFVIIAVPDDAIEDVARKLAEETSLAKNSVVVHTSGALSADVLQVLKSKNIYIASMHPIQTFIGDSNEWVRLSSTYFGLEGETVAIDRARTIISQIGGNAVLVPKEHKGLYHLSCVFLSNYIIALTKAATEILNKSGFSEEESLPMLIPLLQGTVGNLEKVEIQNSLTGPIVRGDVETIKQHLKCLNKNVSELVPLYMELGQILLKIAEENNPERQNSYQEIKSLFTT